MPEIDFVANASDFFKAVSNPRKIKRSPVGGRSKIPRDTLVTLGEAKQICSKVKTLLHICNVNEITY